MSPKRKVVISTILCFILVFTFQMSAFALSAGYVGVNKYSHWWYGSCNYGDRAGASYVNNLSSALAGQFTQSYKYTDSSANENCVKNAQTVDFFVFSGHGLNGTLESSCHFFVRSSGEDWHDNTMERNDTVNASTNECRFRHGYITMYSCNWLTNGGSTEKQTNILNTFCGARLTMGFASIMYLDGREGTLYGNNIKNGMTYLTAFIKAAKHYQPQRKDGDSIARVEGYTSAKDDSITKSVYGPIPSYSESLDSFSIMETVVIPHNGKQI